MENPCGVDLLLGRAAQDPTQKGGIIPGVSWAWKEHWGSKAGSLRHYLGWKKDGMVGLCMCLEGARAESGKRWEEVREQMGLKSWMASNKSRKRRKRHLSNKCHRWGWALFHGTPCTLPVGAGFLRDECTGHQGPQGHWGRGLPGWGSHPALRLGRGDRKLVEFHGYLYKL